MARLRRAGAGGNRRRGRKKGGRRGFGVNRDLNRAQRISDRHDLAPDLSRLDTSTPQGILDAIDRQKTLSEEAGTRSEGSTNNLASLQALFDSSQVRDPDQQELLDLLKGGLGGLTAQENTAFRERGQVGLDRSFQQAQRGLAGAQAARGVRGAAAQAGFRDISRERGAAQGALEQDLQLKNIDVQDKRRSGFSDFLDQLISGEFDRQETALGNLTDQTNTLETNEFDRTQSSLQDLLASLTGAEDDRFKREVLNLGQESSEIGLRNSNLFGLTGLIGNRRNTRKANQLAEEQQRIAQENQQRIIDAFGQAADETASAGTGGV